MVKNAREAIAQRVKRLKADREATFLFCSISVIIQPHWRFLCCRIIRVSGVMISWQTSTR